MISVLPQEQDPEWLENITSENISNQKNGWDNDN
jgi:hypothetical protein